MTLDHAQEAFRANPDNVAAGNYLRTLMKYESDGMIGDGTFRYGIAEVAYWLHYARIKPDFCRWYYTGREL